MSSPSANYDDFEDLELQLERKRKENYVTSKIPISVDHMKWLKQRKESQDTGKGEPSRDADGEKFPASLSPPLSQSERQKSPAQQKIKIYSNVKGDWHPTTATFDSGTAENWMSSDFAKLLKIKPVKVVQRQFKTFTGEVFSSCEKASKIRWCGNADKDKARTWDHDFNIIANCQPPFEVLFGRNFLFSKEVYTFNEGALILTAVKESEKEKRAREKNEAVVEEEAAALAQQKAGSQAARVVRPTGSGGSRGSSSQQPKKGSRSG